MVRDARFDACQCQNAGLSDTVTILLVALFFIGLNWLLMNQIDITWLLLLDIVLWTALQLAINQGIKVHQKKTLENQ